jgi:hypothetical protein
MVGYGLVWCGSGQGEAVSSCECITEPLSSTQCDEFLDQLRTCYLLRETLLHGVSSVKPGWRKYFLKFVMIIEDWQICNFVKVVFSVIKRHANCTKHKLISPFHLTVKELYEILFEIMLQMF